MSTRSRSPVPPPGAGSDAAGAAAASGAATITGTRSSNRRSSRMSMTDNSSGDSGKEDHEAAATSRPSATRKRGRPVIKDNTSVAVAVADTAASSDCKNDTKNTDDNNNNNNNENEEPTSTTITTITTDENKSKKEHKPLVLLGSQPRGIYECDYCGSDLTRTPRIRCATCPDFDLCLECFASEDHEHMARYKREEEARRRKDAAKLAGVELLEEEEKKPKQQEQQQQVVEKNAKRGSRGGKRGRGATATNNKEKKEDDDDDEAALGSYVGGIWVPYFRHKPDHGYIVADSTRYNLLPSFRGVKAVEMVCVEIADDDNKDGNDDEKKKTTTMKEESDVDKANDDEGEEKNVVKGESSGVVVADDKKDELKEAGDDGKGKEKEASMDQKGEGSSRKAEKDVPKDDAMEVDKEEEEKNAKNEEVPDDDVQQLEHDTTKVDAMDLDSSNTKEEKGEGEKKSKDKADYPVKEEESPEPKVDKSNETEEKKEAADEVATEKSDAETTDQLDEDTHKDNEKKQQSASKTQVRRYRVIDDSKNAWTAEEDLRLLDGILTCGLGNWPDIAEHVNGGTSGEGPTPTADASGNSAGGNGVVVGGKTDKMCMYRYLDDFMGRYGNILPPYTMVPVPEGEEDEEEEKNKTEDTKSAPETTDSSDGETVASRKRPRRSVGSTVVEEDDSAPGFKKTKFRVVPSEELDEYEGHWPHPYLPPKTAIKLGEEVGRDLWYKSELSFVRQTTGACNKFDAERIRKEFMERRSQNLTGFEANVLPPRIDDQKELHGAELAGYMPRRGDFDMEWDNDAEKIISEMEFSADDTREDKNLKLDVIRIFNAKLDEREKRKQFIIDQKLLNYRENQEKMWKMAPDERHLVQRMRMFARFHTPEEHEAFVNKIIEAKRLRKEIAKLQTYRRLGITSLADAERYEIDKTRRDLHRTAWLKKEEEKRKAAEEAVRAAKENATMAGVAPPPPAPGPVGASAFDGAGGATLRAMANQSLQVWKQFKASKKESASSASSGEELSSERAKFVIKDKPGYELLSKKEVGLCKRLSILPQDYLNVKKALISESIAQGLWSPQKSKSIFKIDVSQRDGVIDFVLEAGWIPSRPMIS